MLQRSFPQPPPESGPPRLVLLPRAAPPGRLRVWVGAFERDAPPALHWSLNGHPVDPLPLHPGDGSLLPAHPHGTRTFTGTFELSETSITPGKLHEVAVSAGGEPARLLVETLPPEIPSDDWLRILLVSCFHQVEDRKGLAGAVVAGLPEAARPQLTILMGDQVYLDLPTLRDFPNDEAKLAHRFEQNYRKNWTLPEGYRQILAAAPTVASPDDHEFWNNFPHASPVIQNSWSDDGRETWRRAARDLYTAFQLNHPSQLGEPLIVDVPPLSILVLDNRSDRQKDRSRALSAGSLGVVRGWVDRLLKSKLKESKFGAVVTGQSLLDEAAGELKGRVADRVLANYGDYPGLVRELARLAEAGRPVLLLTGDVHWGRVTVVRQGGRPRFYEIICSPSSLVTTVGADQLKTIGEGVRRLFGGKPNPWPRHSDPEKTPASMARDVLGQSYEPEVLAELKGNQVATLALRQRAGGLEVSVTYHPLQLPSVQKRVETIFLPSG